MSACLVLVYCLTVWLDYSFLIYLYLFAFQRSHHLPCKLHGAAALSVRTYADKAASKTTACLLPSVTVRTLARRVTVVSPFSRLLKRQPVIYFVLGTKKIHNWSRSFHSWVTFLWIKLDFTNDEMSLMLNLTLIKEKKWRFKFVWIDLKLKSAIVVSLFIIY